MFNLIMISTDWTTGRATIPIGRMFEYTEERVAVRFQKNGDVDLEKLRELPCLFLNEGTEEQVVFVGQITRSRISGKDVSFEFALDTDVPTLRNRDLYANRLEIDMRHDFEFSRNHWAVKEEDLYRFLLRTVRPRRQRPTVFSIPEHESIESSLVSVMMPFGASFGEVYQSIVEASESVGLRCRRADDIWENPAIIQDVVSLIDRARVVVCDCTGRNPNVFYEIGIAHTLGRDVILITQNENDIPFDLRHLRYVIYLNNKEGRDELNDKLNKRMLTIIGN